MFTEIQSYHALNQALHSDYGALKKSLEKYGSWPAAWKAEQARYPHLNAEKSWEQLQSLGIDLILFQNPQYPPLLKEIPWPPFGIYIKGSLPATTAIAIVGTRKATPHGILFARRLARDLGNFSVTIVSGLALGIDAMAHQGALDGGVPTVAVLANGLDTVYPASNHNLAHAILHAGGALLSEYPPGHPSYPSNFIHRNRIVSGLATATIVIEAPEKSGSLATARFALEQNREVCVVPGPLEHPNYQGSYQLIRAGARLVTSAEDIAEDLNLVPRVSPSQSTHLSGEEQRIMDIIKEVGWPTSIDKIAEISKIEVHKVNQIITFLTIKGMLS